MDTHKRSHMLVALGAATGATRGHLGIAATDNGTLEALRFAAELDTERVWAVEDCRHVSGRLERGLLASGDRVIRVAPGLTETSRKAVREAGKSDPIDATAIARAALREGIDKLPVAHLDEQALEIRILTDYRDQIVTERVRLANRLRWHLVQLAPDIEAGLAPASLDHPQVRSRVARRLARLPHGPQVRVAKLILKRIGQITLEERELRSELTALIEAHCPAAARRARLRPDHRRDHHRPHRRRQTIPHRRMLRPTRRDRPNPRQLREHPTPPPPPRRRPTTQPRPAHHRVLPRARTDPTTQSYLARKHAEGKTKAEAIRCLKRHLARHIWRILYATQPPPSPLPAIPQRPPSRTPISTITATAPPRMPCAR